MSSNFEDFKEQVRDQANIVEIISEYVPLKKRGNSFWGCCPFHGEKTPSFSVTPDKKFFYCYGCHVGGDVFSFIMKIENCTFPEALKLLAGKLGIQVPEREKSVIEIRKEEQFKEIIAANDLARRYYSACLQKTEFGKKALDYLSSREITASVIESFSIGVSLPGFSAMTGALLKRGCTQDVLLKSGLALQGRQGIYDKFRARVMIPIRDARGNVVGFGGRILPGDDVDTAKYMNTAETEWFNKRTLLFGLDVALKAIKKGRVAIIVEGYMDAISLHAAGINAAVASMGTAFSAEQAKLLARIADEVVFSYDSDKPGRNAAVRAVSIAQNAGLRVKVLLVPDGKDPDEFVRKHGAEAYNRLIVNALDGVEFQINQTISQSDVTNLAGKVDAVSNILPFLLECKNDIEVAQYIRKLAQVLTIDEELIMSEYRKQRKGIVKTGSSFLSSLEVQRVLPGEEAEQQLLFVLLESPDLAHFYEQDIRAIGFFSVERAVIFDKLLQLPANIAFSDVSDSIFPMLSEEQASELARILSKDLQPIDKDKFIEDCLRKLKKIHLEQSFEEHRARADEFERMGDSENSMLELAACQRIKNAIKKLY